jgi:hypothetical protein
MMAPRTSTNEKWWVLIYMIRHDLYRDRVMILAPLIRLLILQSAPSDLIVCMRRRIDKLMFSLYSGIRFIIQSENRKSPIMSRWLSPVWLGLLCRSWLIQIDPGHEIDNIAHAFGPFISVFLLRRSSSIHDFPSVDPVITSFSDSHNLRRPNTNEWNDLVIQSTSSWTHDKSIDSAHSKYRTAYCYFNLPYVSPNDLVTRLSSESQQYLIANISTASLSKMRNDPFKSIRARRNKWFSASSTWSNSTIRILGWHQKNNSIR